MNTPAVVLLSLSSGALIALPRRWAFAPLVAGACYLGVGPGLEIAGTHFTAMRLLVVAGGVRMAVRREWLQGGFTSLDRITALWAIWTCLSSAFHLDPKSDLITKLGTVFDACGLYFILRSFCASLADVVRLCAALVFVLIPVAVGMLTEHVSMRNPFAILGMVPEVPMVRDGKIRAFGPFVHPILAGTAGAVALPLMGCLWRRRKTVAQVGVVVCLTIVLASGSSGPVMSAISGVIALSLWTHRHWMRAIRCAAVAIYILLDIFMKVPAYYIIARLDVTGSSTGWHRAALIEASLKHLDEWWFAGTDYTRHWMPSGVSWNPNHTDITNHYLQMGVIGGLPLMLLFIWSLAVGFSYVGKRVKTLGRAGSKDAFVIWALGSALFTHAATFISVSYFDQSVLFIYLTLAGIVSACRAPLPVSTRGRVPVLRGDAVLEPAKVGYASIRTEER